ncbi:hypothetical protein FTW19_03530 [Terriglobus albidus]|uniref:NACHT domain-containing protein n=1 Tax=Terriglobus albidus TaxID=1592106 RepID=A0A5B9EAM4_9BACT|nr:hypothetical protein [Terriglobus albidus]QEE27166.1 hypothetical protein FTW19_03530 [Terriglobus albidus]
MRLPDLDHNWPRYVLPTGASLSLSDGFLPDPEGRYEQYSNPGLLTLGEFFNQRCCILLGDAGIGKSDVLRKEYERVRKSAPQPENVIFCSLRDFGSDVTAEQFLASPAIATWITDDKAELFLFLDSLDEALLRVDTWSTLLTRALGKWPVQRLWFRITCRPAFWPDSLELALSMGFGNNPSKANLAPLRQRDVESAALEHSIQSNSLLNEIRRANAATFAARPLTLKMILGIFTEQNRLPATHVAMYQQGCRYLASEHNIDVLEGHRLTSVPIDRRMVIVERIAAMSVFCDRRLLQHPNAAEVLLPEGTLTASEICSIDVTPTELREVLASALFSFLSPNVLVWTNWSYAEFLAASWCISQQLTTASIRNLISVAGDQGTGIPQQLSSTAIWIGELRRELQRHLVELNPSLLLFIDEDAVNTAILPRLVKHSIERKTTWELASQVSSYAHRFKYPGIVKQLSKYIRRPRKDWECSTALHIAIACDLSELSDELVTLVENKKASLDLRQLAASAIAQTGTKEARKAIRRFAADPVIEDVNDNLKGCALSANWPGNFTLTELMPLLTPPRNPHHAGGYEIFLVKFANELEATLPTADRLILMRWAQQDWLAGSRNAYFDPIIDRIMVVAWEGVQDAAVRRAFVASLLHRLRSHLSGFPEGIGLRSRNQWPERLTRDGERRTLVLRSAILSVENSPYILRRVFEALLVGATDSDQLLEMAREGDDALRKKISTIFFMLGREHPAALAAIYRGTQEGVIDAFLAQVLSVELGSTTAQQLQNEYGRGDRQARARHNKIEEKLETLNQLLDRSEGGEPNAWFSIWDSILVADWPDVHSWGGASRLEQLTCWIYFDNQTRARLYLAAQRCLLNGTRPPPDFLGRTGWPGWAAAEFAALLNTVENSPADLLGVDDDVWQRWSTLAIWYAFTGTNRRDRDFRNFLAQRLPPFIAAMEQVLSLYIPAGSCHSIVDGLRFNWAAEITRFMLEQTRRIDLANSCWDTLVALGFTEAQQLFEEYLWQEFRRLCIYFGKSRDERLVTIVALLLRYAKPGTWTALRDLIFAEPSIGQQAIGRAGDVSQENNWLKQMGDGEVAELYIWMNRQFPANIGQIQGATFFAGPVTIRMLRESALVSMRSRGNLKVFRSVLQALPEVGWLRAQLAYVEEAHFHRRWQVETSEGLLRMAAENGIPWYLKKKSQIILFIVGFLSLAVGIASFITADGTWRFVVLILCSAIFLILAGSVIRLKMLDRRPKQ